MPPTSSWASASFKAWRKLPFLAPHLRLHDDAGHAGRLRQALIATLKGLRNAFASLRRVASAPAPAPAGTMKMIG